MNVAINLLPHTMAILVRNSGPPFCYTRFMRYDGISKTPARRVFPWIRDHARSFGIMIIKLDEYNAREDD